MKKLALTNLILLIAIKSVSACSYAIAPEDLVSNATPKENYDYVFFYASFVLIVPIVSLFFLRKRKGLWAIITAVISLLVFVPAVFVTLFFNACGENQVSLLIIAEFTLMLLIFTFQLVSWISQKETAIKLR